ERTTRFTQNPPIKTDLCFGSRVIENGEHQRQAETACDMLRALDELHRIGGLALLAPAVFWQDEYPAVLKPEIARVVPKASCHEEKRALDPALIADDTEKSWALAQNRLCHLGKNDAFVHARAYAVLIEHDPAHIHEGIDV